LSTRYFCDYCEEEITGEYGITFYTGTDRTTASVCYPCYWKIQSLIRTIKVEASNEKTAHSSIIATGTFIPPSS
jgi:hypothetical protein